MHPVNYDWALVVGHAIPAGIAQAFDEFGAWLCDEDATHYLFRRAFVHHLAGLGVTHRRDGGHRRALAAGRYAGSPLLAWLCRWVRGPIDYRGDTGSGGMSTIGWGLSFASLSI